VPKITPPNIGSLSISREVTPTSSPSHQPKPAADSGSAQQKQSNNTDWVQF